MMCCSLITCLLLCPISLGETGARSRIVEYFIEYLPDPAPGVLEITIVARGLDPNAKTSLYLDNWGEWLEADTYVTELECDPPLTQQDGEHFRLEVPTSWKGTLRARYTLPLSVHGSKRHRQHGLLPWRLGHTAMSYAHNTLMVPHQEGSSVGGSIKVEILAPEEVTVFSGWAGASKESQEVSFDHGIDQCPVIFGMDPLLVTERSGETRFEVVQFGEAEPIAAPVLEFARPFVTAVEKRVGVSFGKPVRIFITGEKPGGGGIRTDHALGLGYHPNLDAYYVSTIGHELHHEWLPGKTNGEASIVWFFEGFNDYFALWHLARAELIERDWFAERLLELEAEARGSEAFGTARFDDGDLDWRDGDGPRETLAYKGGAVMAFLIDAELRRRDRGDLVDLLEHLIERGGYSLPVLKEWLEARRAGDLYQKYIVDIDWPMIEPILERHGFLAERYERATEMTYLGIEADGDRIPATVIGLDPEGPAMKAGFRVGDRIFGYYPTRQGAYLDPQDFESSFRYGLYLLDPYDTKAGFDLIRDGRELRIEIEPQLIDGGRQERRRSDPERMNAFFK